MTVVGSDLLVLVRDGTGPEDPWIILSSGQGRSCQLFTIEGATAEAARCAEYGEVRTVRVYNVTIARGQFANSVGLTTAKERHRIAETKYKLKRRSRSVDEPPRAMVPNYSRDVLNEKEGDTRHRETEPSRVTEADTISLRRVVPTAATARRNRTSTGAASD